MSEDDEGYTEEEIREEQLETMRDWFFERYEDPNESLPYDNEEGDYAYIWGGPYTPREVLFEEFGGIIPKDVINELIDELEDISVDWSPMPKDSDFEDYLLESLSDTDPREIFDRSIENIEILLKSSIDEGVQQYLLKILYANVVAALETFLGDFFINKIMDDDILIRRFIEESGEFKGTNLILDGIFKATNELKSEIKKHLFDLLWSKIDTNELKGEIKKYLVRLLWHRLDNVKDLYEKTLDISFPNDIKSIYKAIFIRHDIVHRNGKNTNGEILDFTEEDIKQIISEVNKLVRYINPKPIDQEIDQNIDIEDLPF